MATFRRGVHPAGNKELSNGAPLVRMPEPEEVWIPVSQHVGAPCVPTVQAGDQVIRGQRIAACDRPVSADVFASVCGEVVAIEPRRNAQGQIVPHIRIRNAHRAEETGFAELTDPTPEQIIARVREAGITGMGGAGFPLAVKLTPPAGKTIDTVIVNGAECEPYLTCDDRVMKEKTEAVADGAALIGRAAGARRVVLAVEDNKPDAAEAVRALGVSVVVCRTKYPQGAEKQLIYAVTRRRVPVGGLPADIGCLVSNVQTAFAVHEAVRKGKPLYERALTVSGRAAARPSNVIVPTGTRLSEVVDFCGGTLTTPAMILAGGPMMGASLPDLESAVTKATGGILLLTKEEINLAPVLACIHCGRCRDACPMNLLPMAIDRLTGAGDYAGAKRYGAPACIECGCCAYACPSKRPLVQSIRLAKKMIREKSL